MLTGKSDTPLVAGAKGAKTDPELIDAVADDPNGISIAALGRAASAGGRVKITDVAGVKPTERTVLLTEYPLSRRVYMITNGKPRGADRDLLAYLMSQKGQQIARSNGLVPVALEDLQ